MTHVNQDTLDELVNISREFMFTWQSRLWIYNCADRLSSLKAISLGHTGGSALPLSCIYLHQPVPRLSLREDKQSRVILIESYEIESCADDGKYEGYGVS